MASGKDELRERIGESLARRDYAEALSAVQEMAQDESAAEEVLGAAASIHIEAGDYEGAIPLIEALLERNPRDMYGIFLKARFFFGMGKPLSSREILMGLLRQEEHLPAVYAEKIYNLLGQTARELGLAEEAAAAYEKAAMAAQSPELRALEYSNYLFGLHFLSLQQEDIYRAHQAYGEIFQGVRAFLHRRLRKRRKIRIGYISPDLRRHVVLRFTEALFTHYDADRFEVYCYQNGPEDEESRRVMQLADAWRNISPFSPQEAARRIYEDDIDILVDLAGHTRGTVLPILAHRPAPVQISGIGYFDTTGLSAVDYVLGDIWLDGEPQGMKEAPFFTEKLLVLPHTHLCYTPAPDAPPAGAAPCLARGYVTFGGFNAFSKASDEALRAWARILALVPDSRLLLKSAAFAGEEGRTAAMERLQAAGIEPARVELRPDTKDYLAEYHDVDIALDTFPYPGGGTTFDALYMGVPVVLLKGSSHGSRFGFSILANLGLAELAAENVADYIEKAAALAKDTALVASLHEKIRRLMEKSPLLDGPSYASDVEAAYQTVFAAYGAERQTLSTAEAVQLGIRFRHFLAAGDLRQALAAADLLLLHGRTSRENWRLMAGLYIDAEEGENARRAVECYLAGGEDGFGLFLRARAVFLLGRCREALADTRRAFSCGDLAQGEQALVCNLMARLCRILGNADEAVEAEKQAFEAAVSYEDKAFLWSNYLFALHYLDKGQDFMLTAAKCYDVFYRDVSVYDHVRQRRHEKIRVGYISPDFRFHIVALFSFAFFTHADRRRFEIYGYSLCEENAMAEELAAHADVWRYVNGVSPEEIARIIHGDEVDILFDLAGHSANNALPVLARKPAPVQISGIGYFDTTGLAAVDYFLTDAYLDPVGQNDAYFTEKLLRLPESHLCYRANRMGAGLHVAALPARKNGFVTFGCFNNFAKVTDEMLCTWSVILATVPRSRLFLKTAVFDTEDGKDSALQRLAAAGIDLSRVRTEGHTAEYLAAYAEVDIALDTYPYPGGGTTCDALYMGVPVITLVGERHGARFGYSLLMNIGLSDACCADTQDEYIKKAAALADDIEQLSLLRRILRCRLQSSSVMDAGRYMTALEASYEKIWAHWLGEDTEPEKERIVFEVTAAADAAFRGSDWPRFLGRIARLLALDAVSGSYLLGAGFASLQVGRIEQAVFYLEQAAAKKTSEAPEIHVLLADAYKRQGNYPAVREYARKAAAFVEETEETRVFRRDMLLAIAYAARQIGFAEEAASCYLAASELAADIPERAALFGSYLLALHGTMISREKLFAEHCRCGELLSAIRPLEPCPRKEHQKIRIGYLSPDFRQHVMFPFIYGLFAHFDHAGFTVYAYDLSGQTDGFTDALRERADIWRDVGGITCEEIARRIQADEIDILVDLAGHSAGGGLPVLAYRPAPVQVSGIGYVNTTGLSCVDYFLTDDIVDPLENQGEFLTEEPVYLTSQFLYTARSDVPLPSAAPCMQTGYTQFGVFNHWYKVTDEMLFLWREIMERVPKSRLLFKSQELRSPAMQEEAYRRMAKARLDLGRVELEPATSDYMERYRSIDIALDTYPYPGGGTTCDALYMGVPVVTRYGRRRSSRFGLSLLQNVGLKELAAPDGRAYVEKAAALAQDKELLTELHRTLRMRLAASPVMQAGAYMTELERFYRLAWEQKREEMRRI